MQYYKISTVYKTQLHLRETSLIDAIIHCTPILSSLRIFHIPWIPRRSAV